MTTQIAKIYALKIACEDLLRLGGEYPLCSREGIRLLEAVFDLTDGDDPHDLIDQIQRELSPEVRELGASYEGWKVKRDWAA